jgi:hypothetical protein
VKTFRPHANHLATVVDEGRHSKPLILLEPAIGFEPMTCALRTLNGQSQTIFGLFSEITKEPLKAVLEASCTSTR